VDTFLVAIDWTGANTSGVLTGNRARVDFNVIGKYKVPIVE